MEPPIASWRCKGDSATHVGPMAQDFHAAFGWGADDKHIAPGDMAGLGLAAVQALTAEVTSLGEQNAELTQRLARLEAALAARSEKPKRSPRLRARAPGHELCVTATSALSN